MAVRCQTEPASLGWTRMSGVSSPLACLWPACGLHVPCLCCVGCLCPALHLGCPACGLPVQCGLPVLCGLSAPALLWAACSAVSKPRPGTTSSTFPQLNVLLAFMSSCLCPACAVHNKRGISTSSASSVSSSGIATLARSKKATQTRTVHCSARSKAVLCGLPVPCPAFGLPEPWLWPACAVACLCPACLWAARPCLQCAELLLSVLICSCTAVCCTVLPVPCLGPAWALRAHAL